jgi:RNA polymerase sigma-70 factor (sigma-E family)
MRTNQEADFIEFAKVSAVALRRTAFLLCRDWHLAQDLTQTTLAKLYVAWPRITWRDYPDAYARKILYRTFLDHNRRGSSQELVTDAPPDRGREESSELRLTMLEALATLSPRDRAIVVLRYWEDHSVDTVADMLDLSVSVVKTQSLRALAKLRTLLDADRFALFG